MRIKEGEFLVSFVLQIKREGITVRNFKKSILATALILGLTTILASVSGQNLGETFDPDPQMIGYFEYTGDGEYAGWAFKGSTLWPNEQSHLIDAAYADDTPELLRVAAKSHIGDTN